MKLWDRDTGLGDDDDLGGVDQPGTEGDQQRGLAGLRLAASVPLALERMIEEGQAKSGETALLIAFGAGLVYAAQVVVVP